MTDQTTPEPLTDDELDAIQQRTDAHGRGGIYGYVINDIEYQGNWVHDIHRLLAEVDRLRPQLEEARQAAGAGRGRAAALEAVYRQTRRERDARSAEIEKLGAQLAEARAELETKSVVHECCEEVVELKKDRAHLKDGLAEAVRERDEARAQLAEARELARRWQRDAHKHREIADSRPGLTQIERAEIRQAATEIEQCSRQLVAEIGPDPAEHGRAVPNSTTYCCICGQPAPAAADTCSDECRTTLADRENACAELTAALNDADFEALVRDVLRTTVYPEPHVNTLITEARRARAKATAAAADAERATADTATARARLAIVERERGDARAELAELREQLAALDAKEAPRARTAHQPDPKRPRHRGHHTGRTGP